jgi:hypothetical protein
MPLEHSSSQSAFEANLKEEMKTHPQKQALAIAYSIRRRAGGEPEVAKAAQGVYQMGSKEAMQEHLRLLQVLASPSHKDDREELVRQAKEMPEIAESVAKADRTIYLDMDGPLANYEGGAKAQGLDPAKAKDVPGFFRGLAVQPGAQAAVADLLHRQIRVVVLSAPPEGREDEAVAEKREWLKEHFPALEAGATFTRDKGEAGEPGDILVDDHPEWANAMGFPGHVIRFRSSKDWEHLHDLAIQEPGAMDAFIEDHGLKTNGTVAKSEHDLGDPPHPAPTDPQKHAGNYKKAHWKLHGLDISIENLAGSTRSGIDPDGNHWEVVMPYHYGYIKKTTGADGDHLDVAIGPLLGLHDEAHIINQLDPKTGSFDEHKVFIGFPTRESAISAFRQGRSDNPDEVMGAVITVPIKELKRWIAEGCLEDEAVLKAEHVAHVKAHYRVVNGKVSYIPGYDKTVHGDHPEATLHQRTVYGAHKSGTHFLRATDAEDREAIKAAAAKAGVEIHHIKRAGANHHGRQNAYDHIHFNTENDAKKVHDMLATEAELQDKFDPKGKAEADDEQMTSFKLDETVKPEPPTGNVQQDLDQLDGLDDAVNNYSHGISQATKIQGYLPGGGASSYNAITNMLQKKATMLSEHGKHSDAAAVHVAIHHWVELAKTDKKKADYIEADLPAIVTQAQATSNPQLFKLAAVISMERAKAEEAKASPDPEKAKLWWTNATSFATLAQKK